MDVHQNARYVLFHSISNSLPLTATLSVPFSLVPPFLASTLSPCLSISLFVPSLLCVSPFFSLCPSHSCHRDARHWPRQVDGLAALINPITPLLLVTHSPHCLLSLPLCYSSLLPYPLSPGSTALCRRFVGEPGLREATGLAILNANYMAKRIEEVRTLLPHDEHC